MKVEVAFTETIVRCVVLELEVPSNFHELSCSDIHELVDDQKGWDQITPERWLTGDVEERTVDYFGKVEDVLGVGGEDE